MDKAQKLNIVRSFLNGESIGLNRSFVFLEEKERKIFLDRQTEQTGTVDLHKKYNIKSSIILFIKNEDSISNKSEKVYLGIDPNKV